MKRFVIVVSSSVVVGYVLLTPTSILLVAPFLLVAYVLLRWWTVPVEDDPDQHVGGHEGRPADGADGSRTVGQFRK